MMNCVLVVVVLKRQGCVVLVAQACLEIWNTSMLLSPLRDWDNRNMSSCLTSTKFAKKQ